MCGAKYVWCCIDALGEMESVSSLRGRYHDVRTLRDRGSLLIFCEYRYARGEDMGVRSAFRELGRSAVKLALILVILSVAPVAAQVDSGTITGTVSDSSGAAIPHAQVIVTNAGTNQAIEVETNSAGIYVSPP